MNYAELNSAIRKAKSSINKLRADKIALEKEIGDIEKEKQDARQNYHENYSKAVQDAKEQHKKDLVAPFERKREEAQNAMLQIQTDHANALDELTEENLLKDCSSQQDILAEVRESIANLRSVIIDVVGERFYDELIDQLDAQEIQIDEDRLEDIVDYFNICSSEISKISQRSGKMLGMVVKVQDTLAQIDGSNIELDTRVTIAICGALLVITVLSYKYIFPFYLAFVVVLAGLNIWRNYKVLKIILTQKTIQDNVESIESMLRAQVAEELEKRISAENKRFEAKKSELQNQIDELNMKIQHVSQHSDSSFVFDESKVKSIFDATVRQKEVRENDINEQLHRIDIDLSKKNSELDALQEQLHKMVGSIQDSYLNADSCGKAYELDTKFILDVVNGKPVIFDYPETSMLFLYSNERDVVDFIKLINLQLRVRLSPEVFTVTVYDPTNMGSDFLCFEPVAKDEKEEMLVKKLFHIIDSEKDFLDELEHLSEDLRSRINTIVNESGDINTYNKFMKSIDALIQTLEFIFIIDPSDRVLGYQSLPQQLLNGSKVGMYYHLFINENTFFSPGSKATDLLDGVSKIYQLSSSGVQPKAKEWILDQIEERKNTR